MPGSGAYSSVQELMTALSALLWREKYTGQMKLDNCRHAHATRHKPQAVQCWAAAHPNGADDGEVEYALRTYTANQSINPSINAATVRWMAVGDTEAGRQDSSSSSSSIDPSKQGCQIHARHWRV